jgi:hypothetical protein
MTLGCIIVNVIRRVKFNSTQKWRFIRRIIFDIIKIDNYSRIIKRSNLNSTINSTNFNVDDITDVIESLLKEKKYYESAKILANIAIAGNISQATDIAERVTRTPASEIFRVQVTWMVMHHDAMEMLIAALMPHSENHELLNLPKTRIINAHGGEYLSILAEGLNISGVLANAEDKLSKDINYAVKLALADSHAIDILQSIKLKQKRHAMKSCVLEETNTLDLAFQATGLVIGHIFGKSLWSGDIIASSHSFVIQIDKTQQPYIFVWFDDIEPWYLMIGTYKGTKNYIYIPGRNIVLLLRGLEHEWYDIHDYIEGFQHYAQKNCHVFNRYLGRKTKSAIYSGGISNLGHYFWNEVQGLHNAKNEGIIDHISNAVLYKHQYIELEKLFPEFAFMEVSKPLNTNEVFVNCIERALFCIHPTAFSMTPECASLVRNTSWALTNQEQKQIINDVDFAGIKIWFNLRSHNKVWVNQVEGATIICEYLLDKYNNVTLVLDGLPECKNLVNEIETNLQGKVKIVDGTSTTLANSISWASNVDLYIATIGSGLAINTWIAEKNGVAHSERTHLGQLEMWKDVRQDIHLPLVPKRTQIEEIGTGSYCNYSINPKLILELVKSIV